MIWTDLKIPISKVAFTKKYNRYEELSVSPLLFIHCVYYFLVIFCVGEFVVGEFMWLAMINKHTTV